MTNELIFAGMHHGSLIVQDLARSINFYCQILGLKESALRPEMPYKGAWLDVGQQQIHLLNLPRTEQSRHQPEHVGRDRHLALQVNNIAIILQQLKKNNIAFSMSKSGRQALFCRDPDGNGLEFIQV